MPVLNFPDIYSELIALLFIAMLAGIIAIRLRQPLIIAFIVVGILVGPAGFNVIKSVDQIHALAEMGLALLLFVVGLKLDPQLIRKMGMVSLATALGQMAFTALVGFILTRALGLSPMMALYLAIAIVFSSTILIVKLLSDKRESDSLYGRIALGFLIVEDIVVVLALIGLAVFTTGAVASPVLQILLIIVKGLGLFAGIWVVNSFVFPRILPMIARSTELLVLFGLTWALLLAGVGDALGFSKEVGAFVAGVSLASTTYRDLLGAKLVSLRDFLLLFFFIELGSHLNIGTLGPQLLVAIPLAILVLIGKPFIIMVIMGVMGYRKRTSFMAGLTVAQISEFSLILVAAGLAAGHVNKDAIGIVTWVLLITMGISTHLIMNAQWLYERCARFLHVFERRMDHHEDANYAALHAVPEDAVILIGLGSYGSNIGMHLVNRGRHVLGVDFNPQAVNAWNAQGGIAVFGDAEDPDFAHALPLETARWVVSSIREPHINSAIVAALRHGGYRGNIALAAHNRLDVPATLQDEADLVYVPFEDAAERAVDLLITEEGRIERRAMDKMINAMTDHYVVCGFGRMGQQIITDFTRQQVPYVVVEDNPEQLPKLSDRRILHVVGNASDDTVLMQAGITRAKGLIAVASTDEANVFIVLTARVLNPDLFIVARSIREENEDKLRRAGANRVMSPYILGGRRMAAAVTKPGIMDFLDMLLHSEKLEAEFSLFQVTDPSPFTGRTVEEIGFGQHFGVSLLAVRRPGEEVQVNPRADFVIHAGDELILMGTPAQLERIGGVPTAMQADV
ncbi:MAG: cation:proton antiporter domain-containing protein [Armatimonadota bacterium]